MRHGEGQTVCRYEFSTARVSLPLPSRGHQEWPLLASTYVRIYLYICVDMCVLLHSEHHFDVETRD